MPGRARPDVPSHDPVPAPSDLATQARVRRICVAVVAHLHPGSDEAVSAVGLQARVQAAVGVVVVAVVAASAVFVLLRLQDPVAARGERAAAGAAVVVDVVGVVARLDPDAHEPVAASSGIAGGEAPIAVAGVAVVALLAGVDHAVAAMRGDAALPAAVRIVRSALLRGVGIAVLHPGLDEAVAAPGGFAGGRASVGVVVVPVVALLEAFDPAVAADRRTVALPLPLALALGGGGLALSGLALSGLTLSGLTLSDFPFAALALTRLPLALTRLPLALTDLPPADARPTRSVRAPCGGPPDADPAPAGTKGSQVRPLGMQRPSTQPPPSGHSASAAHARS